MPTELGANAQAPTSAASTEVSWEAVRVSTLGPPVAGDLYLCSDTPTVVNQRIYVCTTSGPGAVWSGIL